MEIRKYVSSDCKAMADLFYETVHEINQKDYTKQQLDAWATGKENLEQWNHSFLESHTFVAYEGEKLVGFGNYRKGCLDLLYVHHQFQRQGIATAILLEIEQVAKAEDIGEMQTYASITATPFFQKKGFVFVTGQEVERDGIFLRNYVMEKEMK